MNVEQLKRFVGRTNPYALQLKKGGYIPIRKEITDEELEKHLKGESTYGSYVIKEDGTTNYGVIDIDGNPDELNTLKVLGETIYALFPDFNKVLEFSGRRGYHVWIFPKNPEPPAFIRELIKTRLKKANLMGHEVFPKQDSLSGIELGNLIKLPCGKHQQGSWSEILKEDNAK